MSDCPKCHQKHLDWRGRPGCTSHVLDRDADGRKILGTDRPCRKLRLSGLEICTSHGVTKAGREAAKRNVTEQKAAKIMARFGGPIDTTPSEGLLDSIRWTAGFVAFLREQLARTVNDAENADDLIWGKTKAVQGDVVVGDGPKAKLEKAETVTEEATASVWESLLLRWQKEYTRMCAEAIRIGIEERRVRMAESQGAMVAEAMRGTADAILKALLAAGMADKFAAVFQAALAQEAPRHLRLLAGGAA